MSDVFRFSEACSVIKTIQRRLSSRGALIAELKLSHRSLELSRAELAKSESEREELTRQVDALVNRQKIVDSRVREAFRSIYNAYGILEDIRKPE